MDKTLEQQVAETIDKKYKNLNKEDREFYIKSATSDIAECIEVNNGK